MTKAEIAERIHTKLGFTKKDSMELLESIFSIMKQTLESGENIKVAGFGNFEIKQKEDRIGRNPQTTEVITIAARKVLSFKPSKLLKAEINKQY